MADRRRLLRTVARHNDVVAFDLAVGLFRESARLFGLDIAGDHHHRAVRAVEAPIKADGVVARQLLHLVAPADDRPAVRAIEVERGVDLLAEPGARIVADALVLLLENDLALGQHHFVGELQAGHAVGLEFHHGLELLARYALVIAGVVARGEGVFLAADAGDDFRELSGRMLGGALEHQMFEEMRQTRFARGLVGGADFVPDHMGDDRRAVIGDDHQFEPVLQHKVGNLDAGGRRRCGASDQGRCDDHGDGETPLQRSEFQSGHNERGGIVL